MMLRIAGVIGVVLALTFGDVKGNGNGNCVSETTPLDIVWVVDESNSITPRNYVKVRDFVKRVQERLFETTQDARVGLVEFGGQKGQGGTYLSHPDKYKRLDMNEVSSSSDFEAWADSNMRRNGASTNILFALETLRTDYFLAPGNAKRDNSFRLVIFLTDGIPDPMKPDSEINAEGNLMMEAGNVDRFLYLTIGKKVNFNLFNSLENFNGERDRLSLATFNDLSEFVESLIEIVTTCDYVPPPCGCETANINAYCKGEMQVTEMSAGSSQTWSVSDGSEFVAQRDIVASDTKWEFACTGEGFVGVVDLCGQQYFTDETTTETTTVFRFNINEADSSVSLLSLQSSDLSSFSSLADKAPYTDADASWVWDKSTGNEIKFTYDVGPIRTCAPTKNPTVSPTLSPTLSPTGVPTPFTSCAGAGLLVSIDQSLSIQSAEFQREKEVVSSLIDMLPFDSTDVGVSAVSFGLTYVDIVPVSQVADAGVGRSGVFVKNAINTFIETTTQQRIRFTNFIPLFEEHGVALSEKVSNPTILILSDGEPYSVQYRGGRKALKEAILAADAFGSAYPGTKILCFQSDATSKSKYFFKYACDAIWLAKDRRQDNPPELVALEMMQNHICSPNVQRKDPCQEVNDEYAGEKKAVRKTICGSIVRDARGRVVDDDAAKVSLLREPRKHCYWDRRTGCTVLRRYAPLYDTYNPGDAA